jgi:hypothetical protein
MFANVFTIGIWIISYTANFIDMALLYYLYLTVPRFVYEANGIRIQREKNFIATIVGVTAVAFNFLAWNGQAIFAFIFSWLPFVALLSPLIALKRKGLASQDMGSESKTASTLMAVGWSMALIAFCSYVFRPVYDNLPTSRAALFARGISQGKAERPDIGYARRGWFTVNGAGTRGCLESL